MVSGSPLWRSGMLIQNVVAIFVQYRTLMLTIPGESINHMQRASYTEREAMAHFEQRLFGDPLLGKRFCTIAFTPALG